MTTTPERPTVTLQIDSEAGAAYLRFGDRPVARTEEFAEDLVVDLDEFGMVVGVEILDMETSVNLDQLSERFHIEGTAFDLLKQNLRWAASKTVAESSSSWSDGSATTFSSGTTASC